VLTTNNGQQSTDIIIRRISVNQNCQGYKTESQKMIQYKSGKTYFSRQVERKFFFILTIIMLLLGLLAKAGLF